MRITESVLRGLIRETLLREGPNTLGGVPAAPIAVSRRDTGILKKLQGQIVAPETGKYDADTENAWDEYIATYIGYHRINGVSGGMSVEIRTDWAEAAGAIKTVDGVSKTFTPNIQGMYDFAWLIAPKAEPMPTVAGEDDAGEALPTGPYRTADQPDVWPTGVTLDDAEKWNVQIGDSFMFGTNASPVEMYNVYQTIVDAFKDGKLVKLIGAYGTLGYLENDGVYDDSYPITIERLGTLDMIFKGTNAERAAEQEAKTELETRFDYEEDED